MFVENLKSVAQLERTIKAFHPPKIMLEAFNALTEKPPGKITIAPVDDVRTAVGASRVPAEEAFAGVPLDAPATETAPTQEQ